MDASLVLLQFVPLAIILTLANLAQRDKVFRWLTYLALALLNVLFIGGGLLGLLLAGVDASSLPGMPAGVSDALVTVLRAVGLVGILGFAPFIRPLRALLARLIPIDPDSIVHTTALVFAIYLVGLGLGQQPLLTDPEVVEALGLELNSSVVWAQGLGMVILALPGVGAFLRRNGRETLERLGLAPLSLRQIGIALGATLILIGFQVAVTALWQALDPAAFERLDAANNLLFGQFVGPLAALTLGLSAAIGEELVFRGALQPRFGLLLTALLFTVVHSQYGFSPASVLILAIALVLGFLRQRINLTACILVHFSFNFLSVLLASAV